MDTLKPETNTAYITRGNYIAVIGDNYLSTDDTDGEETFIYPGYILKNDGSVESFNWYPNGKVNSDKDIVGMNEIPEETINDLKSKGASVDDLFPKPDYDLVKVFGY